jgi:hypothetical protein
MPQPIDNRDLIGGNTFYGCSSLAAMKKEENAMILLSLRIARK